MMALLWFALDSYSFFTVYACEEKEEEKGKRKESEKVIGKENLMGCNERGME